MPILPLIKNPDQYTPCSLDLLADPKARQYWLSHFDQHLSTLEPLLCQPPGGPKDRHAVAGFIKEMRQLIADIGARPEDFAPLTILALDRHRQRLLQKFGFDDPYTQIKAKENASAIALYPQLIGELNGHRDEKDLILTLVQGIFAGNIFDMGALATVERYNHGGHDFFQTRQSLRPRPWPIDDFDALAEHLLARRYRNVLFFVDNAGADLILGCLPFAKYLAKSAARLTLVANSTPTLNDITYDELQEVLKRIAAIDPEFAGLIDTGRVSAIASGTGEPLIDLSEVSARCAELAGESDFLILEGMGRSIESNYHVQFTCPTLKIALLKDIQVAESLGARMYDPVCRFES